MQIGRATDEFSVARANRDPIVGCTAMEPELGCETTSADGTGLALVCSRAFGHATGSRSAIILSHSASLRESLQVLLGALPQLGQIYQVGGFPELLSLDLSVSPDLVLYDLDAARENAWTTLGRIKDRWPHCCCLAMIEDEVLVPKAHAAGADMTLLKGILASRLLDTLKELIGEKD